MQSALFRIATLSREARNLDEFYGAVHGIVDGLMDATNFYIAEYDAARDILTFPYFVDEYDRGARGTAARPRTDRVRSAHRQAAAGHAGGVRRSQDERRGRVGRRALGRLARRAARRPATAPGASSACRRTTKASRYTERDRDLLVFVAQHVASAIEQKRQEDALRESERRYRQMFENNRAVQILLDPDQRRASSTPTWPPPSSTAGRVETLRSMHIWQINILDEDARPRARWRTPRSSSAATSSSATGSPTATSATSKCTPARSTPAAARSSTRSSTTSPSASAPRRRCC